MNIHEHVRREALKYYEANTTPTASAVYEAVKWMAAQLAFQDTTPAIAQLAVDILAKLVRGEVLTPLTGEEAEWSVPVPGTKVQQNIRYPWVLRNATEAWDTNAVWYEDPTGLRYMLGGKIENITFPYTPTTRTIPVDEDGEPIDNPDCIA